MKQRQNSQSQSTVLPTRKEISALLLPIVKRMPAYFRLGWATAWEPTIPLVHRSGLYITVAYVVSPAHIAMNAFPILGQMDVVLLLLVSLRQALRNCPPETLARLCERLKIKPAQLDEDISTLLGLAAVGVKYIYEYVTDRSPFMTRFGASVTFGGRVAGNFARRVTVRLLGGLEHAIQRTS